LSDYCCGSATRDHRVSLYSVDALVFGEIVAATLRVQVAEKCHGGVAVKREPMLVGDTLDRVVRVRWQDDADGVVRLRRESVGLRERRKINRQPLQVRPDVSDRQSSCPASAGIADALTILVD